MTTYQILYWHDIPLQVRAREGRNRVSKPLSDRFQDAVDRASMAAGLTGTDEYLNLMRWSEPVESDLSPDEIAESLVKQLEAAFQIIPWQNTAAALIKKTQSNYDG